MAYFNGDNGTEQMCINVTEKVGYTYVSSITFTNFAFAAGLYNSHVKIFF